MENLNDKQKGKLIVVRQEIWKGAIKGLGAGLLIGYWGYHGAKKLSSLPKKFHHSNYLIATVLVCTSLGSFLGAVTEGKNSVAFLTDIFHVNPSLSSLSSSSPSGVESSPSKPPVSSYRSIVIKNEQGIHESVDETFIRRAAIIKQKQENDRIEKEKLQNDKNSRTF